MFGSSSALVLALVTAAFVVWPQTAHAIPIVDASKDDALTIDIDGDGLADPGDTIRYTIAILNSGNMDAIAVSFSDPIDGNSTLVAGSLKTTPVAVNDAYNVVGNVSISVSAPGVLGNDSDPDGGAVIAIAIVGGSSTNGGDVDLAADGSFTYDPPPGHEGPDTFTYDIQDADSNTDTATVMINVSGMIWFVDGSGANGDGRLSSPFNCLVGTGCFDPAAADETGDNVFVYEGSYNGGLTLLNSQKLIGDGSSGDLATVTGLTLPAESVSLPAFIGTKPEVTGTGDGVGLGQNNTIRGLDIGSGTGTGIRGTSVGTLTVSETSISGGGGIDIDGGTLAVSLDDLSASSSTDEGIRLTNVTGTFNIVDTTGTISTTNVAAVDITGTGGGVSLGVTFASVSSTGSSTNGINLDTTTGSFTVTGTGPAGSGGTIADILTGSNGASAGIGVRLNNATNVSLSSMQLNDFFNFAIRGTNVTNFDLTDTTINGANGNSAAFDEGGVSFSNLLGSANFTNNTISGGLEDNLRVVNTSGTLNRVTVSGGTIGLNSTSLGNDGVFFESQGSATLNVTVEDVFFVGARGDLLQTNAIGNSTMDIVVRDNTFENTHPNIVSAGGGITLSGGSGGGNINVTYDVFGTTFGDQTFRDAEGNAITINYLNGAGTVTGTVENNTIGVTGVTGSGSATQSGMLIGSGGSLTHTVTINNNDVRSIGGWAGMDLSANSSSTLNATITNNTIDEMSGFVLAGMYLLAGGGASDTSTLCSDIRNNTVDAGGASFASSMFFDQISVSANHNLPQYSGSPHGEFGSPNTGTASVDIESYLLGRGNSLTAGGSAFFNVDASLVQGVTGIGTTCPLTAALGEGPGGMDVELLANVQLLATASRAIELWSASGLSRSEMIRLQGATFEIVDLPDGQLGSTSPGRVMIDHNGAGYGWFVAQGLEDHGSFMQFASSTELLGLESSEVCAKMDLLTAVMHELGHVLGKGHADQPDLMADTLATGVRRRPTAPHVSVPTDRADATSGIHTEERAEARTPKLGAPLPCPAGAALASSIMAAVLNATASGETVNLTIGTLNPGQTVTITFEVTVDNPLPEGTTNICNQGLVEGDNFGDELTDDPAVVGVDNPTCTGLDQTQPSADLSITKDDSVDPVIAGDPLVYTVTVTNNGPSDAQNVEVTDVLPAGVTFNSTTGCAEDPGGVPTCSLGTIAAGGAASYTIEVLIDSGTLGTISNTASVSSDVFDPDPNDNTVGEDTTVDPRQGACCDGSSCTVDTEDGCIASGGTYQGDDTTCDPSPCICGDLDGDRDVGGQDFQMFLASFGRSLGDGSGLFNPAADFDGDNMVTFVDYQVWLKCFRAFVGNPLAVATLFMQGDFDADFDVDLNDYAFFWDCMTGAYPEFEFPCMLQFDFDMDGVIDLKDYGAFQNAVMIPAP